MIDLDPISLAEHVAVVPIECVNCGNDIDIGDDCYVDESAGLVHETALIYCKTCVEEYYE